jgi:hypothetical protein
MRTPPNPGEPTGSATHDFSNSPRGGRFLILAAPEQDRADLRGFRAQPGPAGGPDLLPDRRRPALPHRSDRHAHPPCTMDLEPMATTWATVGWSMPETPHAEIATPALRIAIEGQRPAPGLIQHSIEASEAVSTGRRGASSNGGSRWQGGRRLRVGEQGHRFGRRGGLAIASTGGRAPPSQDRPRPPPLTDNEQWPRSRAGSCRRGAGLGSCVPAPSPSVPCRWECRRTCRCRS